MTQFILLQWAPTSRVPLLRQNCIIRSNAKTRTGIKKVESVCFQLYSWCRGTPRFRVLQLWEVKCPKCPHTHRQRQQHLGSHRQNLCTLTGLVRLSTLSTTISSSCHCEMPAWLQVTGHLYLAVGGPCIGDGSCKKFRNPSLGKTLTSLLSTHWKTSKTSSRASFPKKLPSKIPIQWGKLSNKHAVFFCKHYQS